MRTINENKSFDYEYQIKIGFNLDDSDPDSINDPVYMIKHFQLVLKGIIDVLDVNIEALNMSVKKFENYKIEQGGNITLSPWNDSFYNIKPIKK